MPRGLDKYIHWNQGNKIVDVRDLTHDRRPVG